MSDEVTERARADFSRARFKSFINQVFSVIAGKHTATLLSCDEIKEKLRIGGSQIGAITARCRSCRSVKQPTRHGTAGHARH